MPAIFLLIILNSTKIIDRFTRQSNIYKVQYISLFRASVDNSNFICKITEGITLDK